MVDLSTDQTPTLVKLSADLVALGGRHICDLSITVGEKVLHANRFYAIGDSTVALGLLRKTENLSFFPAMPVLAASTRFSDGRQHQTVNQPVYRRKTNVHVTRRCFLGVGGSYELFALHRQRVDRLITAGANPVPAPTSAAQVIELMRQDHEDSQKAWRTSPYSYGDAIHEAFKIFRREYLVNP